VIFLELEMDNVMWYIRICCRAKQTPILSATYEGWLVGCNWLSGRADDDDDDDDDDNPRAHRNFIW
jgi:hypothetical protein